MMEKPGEPLPDFIVRVQTHLERKLPPGGLRDQFTKLLVWEGMNRDTRMAWAALREGTMNQWAVASQNVGTQSRTNQTLVVPFRPGPKLLPLLLVKPWWLDSKSKHLGNVSMWSTEAF